MCVSVNEEYAQKWEDIAWYRRVNKTEAIRQLLTEEWDRVGSDIESMKNRLEQPSYVTETNEAAAGNIR